MGAGSPVPVARRRTARLLLRRPEDEDLAWATALHCDPDNYRHAPDGAHDREQARALAEAGVAGWQRDGIGYWIVELDGDPVGMAGLVPMSFQGRPCFNLYYRFAAAGRGRGFAAESGREALDVAAALDPARPVVVRTRAANAPARRLADALGLVRRPELEGDAGFIVYVSAW